MSSSALGLSPSLNVLVVAPGKVLLVALAVLLTELTLAAVAPWLLLRLRTTAAQRAELSKLAHSIASLRAASNRLNSPATFAEYSKVQRTLNHELKRQAQLQAEINGGGSGGAGGMGAAAAPLQAVQQFALGYGIKAAVYLLCFLSCVGSTLFVVPLEGWMGLLKYTPLRFVTGEVGIVPYMAMCSALAASIKHWL